MVNIQHEKTARPECRTDGCKNPCNKNGKVGPGIQVYAPVCSFCRYERKKELKAGAARRDHLKGIRRQPTLSSGFEFSDRRRGNCVAAGCPNPQAKKINAQTQALDYESHCSACLAQSSVVANKRARERARVAAKTAGAKVRLETKNKPCIRCGWAEGPSQVHRIVPGRDGGRYTRDNVVPLCPNCHSLVTFGLINEYTA